MMREFAAANPPRKSTGLVPLPDLGKRLYKGEQGGLYPGGRNTPPKRYGGAGIAAARSIVPLDADGKPAAMGKIGLASIGMSNTTQESQAFRKLLATTPGVNPRLVFADCAQGGQTAAVTARGGFQLLESRGPAASGRRTGSPAGPGRLAETGQRSPQGSVPGRGEEAPRRSGGHRPKPPRPLPEPALDLRLEPHLRGLRGHTAQSGAPRLRDRLRREVADRGSYRRRGRRRPVDRLGTLSVGRWRGGA